MARWFQDPLVLAAVGGLVLAFLGSLAIKLLI